MATLGAARRPDPRRAGLLSRYTTDRLARFGVGAGAAVLLALLVAVYFFIGSKALLIFAKVPVTTFFFGTHWDGLAQPPSYGAGAIIFGSIAVVGLAVLIATPLSLGAALFLEQTDRVIGDRVLRPVIEVFVGIPSVVYGWIGLTVLVPFIARTTHQGVGLSVLAGALVLSIMIVPTITTLSADALARLEPSLAESSYALGATRWQTIRRVLLPSARAGIVTGIVFGVARAMGEALAVALVIGNVPNMPKSIFSPVATMTTIITQDLPNRALNPDLNNALYTLGLVLLLLSLGSIVIVRRLSRARD